jgi:cytochrome P450
VRGIDEIRRRMGEVMLATVFGEGSAPVHLIEDIQELFAEVGLRTAVAGSRKGALRDRFRGELRRLWRDSVGTTRPSFMTLAHPAASAVDDRHRREELLLDQIPHWMFTFTNSGSDLLARSLAMIVAREECLDRVRGEIASAGSPSQAESIHGLAYLEACIRETGRLYPPVVQASHSAAREHVFEGIRIPAGTEMIQFFPFVNRDTSRDPLANSFRPERWLDPAERMHERYSNLFLSGPRACPGRDLILFVIKSAIALQLSQGRVQARRDVLTSDPLPFSFPRQLLS